MKDYKKEYLKLRKACIELLDSCDFCVDDLQGHLDLDTIKSANKLKSLLYPGIKDFYGIEEMD
jgi:hypothetical protein